MNVAIITDSFPPMIDGVSRCALGYALALQEGGHGNSIVITPRMPRIKYDYPFPVYGFSSVSLPYAEYRAGHPFTPYLINILRSMDIDILHAHSPFTSMLLARQLRRYLKIPIVFTQHTKWDVDIAQAISAKILQRRIERYVYKNLAAADDLWAVSRGAGEYLISRGYNGGYTVMPNGTDFPKTNVDPSELKKLNDRLNLPDDVPVLLFVGRMMWYKNIGLILNSLEELKRRRFDFRMLFVGDGEDMPEIQKTAKNMGLSGNVHFAGRIDSRDELMAYYTRSDLFILISMYDNAPLVIQEAAACACPSLVASGSSTAEVLEDGVNGYFVDDDPKSVASTIQKIFSDRESLERVSLAALEQVYLPWGKAIERAIERYEYIKEIYDHKTRRRKAH